MKHKVANKLVVIAQPGWCFELRRHVLRIELKTRLKRPEFNPRSKRLVFFQNSLAVVVVLSWFSFDFPACIPSTLQKKIHFSHHETNTSLIFHMWQVKNEDQKDPKYVKNGRLELEF
jgi:hypothetical protein